MNIIKLVKDCNFPKDSYVVIGGAALSLRGIKETRDIDILVTSDLITSLKNNKKWRRHVRINSEEEPGLISEEGLIELYPTMGGVKSFKELLQRAELVDGIPVASLEDILAIKRFYKREKDMRDIKLIEEYQRKEGGGL